MILIYTDASYFRDLRPSETIFGYIWQIRCYGWGFDLEDLLLKGWRPLPVPPVVSSKFSTVPMSWNFRHSCRNAPHWNPKKHLACYHPNGPTPLWFCSMRNCMRTFSRTCLQGSWKKALQGMVTRKAAQKHSKSCWLLTAPALVDIPHPSHTPPAFGVDLTASCVTAALSEQTDIANPRCLRKFEIEDSGW